MLLEAAEEEKRSGDARDLRQVLAAAEELRARLGQLLRTALAEARQGSAADAWDDVDELIDAAVASMKPLADAKANTIAVQIGAACLARPSDPTRFRQCIEALLARAVSKTSNSLITIQARQRSDAQLVLPVIDAGP